MHQRTQAMPLVKALELEGSLAQAASAPLCVLAGSDEALRARSLGLVRAAAAPPEQPGSSVREFDGAPEARDVFDELNTIPFLGLQGRRVAVVRDGDAFARANAERLARYLKDPSRTSTLILCVVELLGSRRRRPARAARPAPAEGKRAPDALDALVKAIRARAWIVDCNPITWADAKRWLRSRGEAMGVRFTPRAVDALVEAVGPNLLALDAEAEKLAAYCGPQATVSERDVAAVAAAGRSRSIFDLSDAVCSGDARQALRMCDLLLLQGETREGIVALLGRQVRRLWQVKRLRAAGGSEQEIGRQLSVPPFAVRRSIELADGRADEWFARQLCLLSAADVEAKTTSIRSGEERVWLESLLLRLCNR
jgi:DNA polymerase III delta subunit